MSIHARMNGQGIGRRALAALLAMICWLFSCAVVSAQDAGGSGNLSAPPSAAERPLENASPAVPQDPPPAPPQLPATPQLTQEDPARQVPVPVAPVQTGPLQTAPSATPVSTPLPAPAAKSATPQIAPETAKPAGEKEDAPKQDALDAYHMFKAADPVVKAVMIILAIGSVLAWTIFAVMMTRITALHVTASRALVLLKGSHDAMDQELPSIRGDTRHLLKAAREEYRLSPNGVTEAMIERARDAMHHEEIKAGRRVGAGLSVLATIGSTGPFVGLLGTVWGIMHSFVNIANTGTTNLSVVAPGIAEALLATAIGLVAAIPAVVFYNVLTRRGAHYRSQLSSVSSVILRNLSRELDGYREPESRIVHKIEPKHALSA